MAGRRRKGQAEVERKASILETLEIEYVPIDSISANDYNPNRQSDHDFELLCRSMREDGFTQPVIVVREGRVIVDGFHRWKAAHEIGMTEIPVVFTDMSIEQARIATLRHNRARGTEDTELSVQVLRDLEALGARDWAQESLQISDQEFERLMEDVPAPDGLAGEEFSEGWDPVKLAEEDGELRSGDGVSSSTFDAAVAREKAEEEMKSAKTQAERKQALRDADLHRVYLTFTGEEGRIVKEVLGAQPAAKVLELCRATLE